MKAPTYAPTWNPERQELRYTHAGVTIVITQDEADCTIVEVRPDPIGPPPLQLKVDAAEVHSTIPDEAEWQARVEERRPQKQAEANRRTLTRQVIAKLGPGATPQEMADAFAEALIPESSPTAEKPGVNSH